MEARRPSLRERMATARQQQQSSAAAARATGGSSGNGLSRVYRTARQSGQLNLSSRGLASFPPEILKLHTLVEEVRAHSVTERLSSSLDGTHVLTICSCRTRRAGNAQCSLRSTSGEFASALSSIAWGWQLSNYLAFIASASMNCPRCLTIYRRWPSWRLGRCATTSSRTCPRRCGRSPVSCHWISASE